VNSSTKITFVVGDGTSTGTISVRTAAGTATSATAFKVSASSISSFSPVSGNSGTKVVIKGTGFIGTTSVTVNGTPARSVTVNSATMITFVVGTGTTAGPIQVATPGGAAVSTTNFTIKGTAK
jgi:hypothetical protein